MSEINWDLAPEGAVELVRNGFRVAYRDKAGNAYLSTGWEYSESWDLAEVIATRPQTKTVADEGEKWKHVDIDGNRCGILARHDGAAWVTYCGDFPDKIIDEGFLFPIKPKLTKAGAWDRCIEEFGVRNIKYVMQELMDEFEII